MNDKKSGAPGLYPSPRDAFRINVCRGCSDYHVNKGRCAAGPEDLVLCLNLLQPYMPPHAALRDCSCSKPPAE